MDLLRVWGAAALWHSCLLKVVLVDYELLTLFAEGITLTGWVWASIICLVLLKSSLAVIAIEPNFILTIILFILFLLYFNFMYSLLFLNFCYSLADLFLLLSLQLFSLLQLFI